MRVPLTMETATAAAAPSPEPSGGSGDRALKQLLDLGDVLVCVGGGHVVLEAGPDVRGHAAIIGDGGADPVGADLGEAALQGSVAYEHRQPQPLQHLLEQLF